jgi:hypothetical protein
MWRESTATAAAATGISVPLLVDSSRRQLRRLRLPGRKRYRPPLSSSQAAEPFTCYNLGELSACLARRLPCLAELAAIFQQRLPSTPNCVS